MNKELENKIKEDIKKSGFPLEIESSLILNKKGWSVVNSSRYYNENKKDYSEIDIVATKEHEIKGIKNILIIECKKFHEGQWVFFKQEISKPNVYNLNIVENGRNISSYSWFDKNLMANHHYLKNPICTYSIVPHTKGKGEVNEKKQKMIYDAVSQVVEALMFYLIRDNKMLNQNNINEIYLVYPVIVFDGPLFSASVKEGDIELKEENHIQLLFSLQLNNPFQIQWDYKSRKVIKQKNIIIDIVKKEYFEEYLKNFN
ncbi:MAG: hypothetical protein PHN56_00765 [Candidatus Nanoarchaeia archaeon]|nr:hypothetical protein [Candidatus Nanoarchaeia archaeon]